MVMIGPRYWRNPVHGIKKCSEGTRKKCTDHKNCCAVTACTYCLELEIYGKGIKRGKSEQSDNHWTGLVDGHNFDMSWDRDYLTDECVLVVLLDGVEVYRKSCYEGQSCRDSSDEVGVIIGYDDATLRWKRHEPLPLPHKLPPEGGCVTWFCGECECSCYCICVTITEPDDTVLKDELCNINYECEGPRWVGQIGYYDLDLALGRDSYGNCVLESTVNGSVQDAVPVTGCKNMSATITLYSGTTISVSCKICSCDEEAVSLCCGGRDLSGTLYLRLVYPGTSSTVECGDSFFILTDAGGGNWYASGTVLVEIPGGGGEECVPISASFWFFCDPAGPVYQLFWKFTYLGSNYPFDISGDEWCVHGRASENCDYPYLASWNENPFCGSFWNDSFTYVISEVPI